MARRHSAAGARRFTSIAVFHPVQSLPSNDPIGPMIAALLTRTSIRPVNDCSASKIRAGASETERSMTKWAARWFSCRVLASRAHSVFKTSPERATRKTSAPRRQKASEISAPRPRDAPVTSTVLPEKHEASMVSGVPRPIDYFARTRGFEQSLP